MNVLPGRLTSEEVKRTPTEGKEDEKLHSIRDQNIYWPEDKQPPQSSERLARQKKEEQTEPKKGQKIEERKKEDVVDATRARLRRWIVCIMLPTILVRYRALFLNFKGDQVREFRPPVFYTIKVFGSINLYKSTYSDLKGGGDKCAEKFWRENNRNASPVSTCLNCKGPK
jgi:hypothetical protein